MKPRLIAVAFWAALGCQTTWAQVPGDCQPSTLNIPGANYPCVYADNRVLFRVVAPNAQKVSVRVGPGFDMVKGPDNVTVEVVEAKPIPEGAWD